MTDLYSSAAAFRSGSKGLLKLLDLDGATPEGWQAEDMAAMVRHQLSAPLRTDLSATYLGKDQLRGLESILRRGAGMRIMSFGDLLFHRDPPTELLRLSKEFFKKKSTSHEKESPEWKVAFLFYMLFILAANQHNHNISKLPDHELVKFLKWALTQDWVDGGCRELLAKAQQRLRGTKP